MFCHRTSSHDPRARSLQLLVGACQLCSSYVLLPLALFSPGVGPTLSISLLLGAHCCDYWAQGGLLTRRLAHTLAGSRAGFATGRFLTRVLTCTACLAAACFWSGPVCPQSPFAPSAPHAQQAVGWHAASWRRTSSHVDPRAAVGWQSVPAAQ